MGAQGQEVVRVSARGVAARLHLRQHWCVQRERPSVTGLVAAFGSVAAITLLIYPLREAVPVVSTGVVYALAVLFVSSYWGLFPGLLTALLSSAAWNFFHIPPTGGFTIAERGHWIALAVFLSRPSRSARSPARPGRVRRRRRPVAVRPTSQRRWRACCSAERYWTSRCGRRAGRSRR